MKTTNLNDLEQSFLNAVQKEHLTSYEILQRVEDVSDPIESLRGGTTYLNILYNRFEDIEDDETRIKFTLASFNCGYEHVRDAQRLADFNNLDPTVWENNVAEMFLELRFPKNYNRDFIKYGYVRGTEPVNYVRQIFERYHQYKQFITDEEDDKLQFTSK